MLTKLNYDETVEELFKRKPKKTLDMMAPILAAMNQPHLKFPTIHIGGSNGKGGVAAKIAYALQDAGYKVGLFSSPHLFDYAERISINGRNIPHEKVVWYDEEMRELMDEQNLSPNFFECTTCYGFRYFAEEKVDIAVIEVGLGGRFDSTNIIQPLLSIISSISMDHMDYLGETIESIAWHKAGIIKKNTPVVIGPNAKYAPIFMEAKEKNAPLYLVEKISCFYDTENQSTAKKALSLLPFALPTKSLEKGLKTTLPCRFDKRGRVIYDVAHNPDGFERLIAALEHIYPKQKFRFLIGMSRSKDLKGCLSKLLGKAIHIHFVQSNWEQSVPAKELGEVFQSISNIPYNIEPSIQEGMLHAKAALGKRELLIVCGSFYIMLDALSA